MTKKSYKWTSSTYRRIAFGLWLHKIGIESIAQLMGVSKQTVARWRTVDAWVKRRKVMNEKGNGEIKKTLDHEVEQYLHGVRQARGIELGGNYQPGGILSLKIHERIHEIICSSKPGEEGDGGKPDVCKRTSPAEREEGKIGYAETDIKERKKEKRNENRKKEAAKVSHNEDRKGNQVTEKLGKKLTSNQVITSHDQNAMKRTRRKK